MYPACLTQGLLDVKIKQYQDLTLTYENRYRHLLSKDKYFEQQLEYRFIVLDVLISKPVAYQYELTSEYILVPIDELKHEIEVQL